MLPEEKETPVLFARSRQEQVTEMLRTIEAECRWTAGLTGIATVRPAILDAMADVPRDAFVPPGIQAHAFANNALPIGEGQTISQPFIVALMTELLDPVPGRSVLEIGTGSGYQAAILARLVGQVWSVEIIPALAREAAERLQRLGFDNVAVRSGDGYLGWKEYAPFDAVMITAAAERIPQPLIDQLKDGGRLIMPLGSTVFAQTLILATKRAGKLEVREIAPVAFVPMTGEVQKKR